MPSKVYLCAVEGLPLQCAIISRPAILSSAQIPSETFILTLHAFYSLLSSILIWPHITHTYVLMKTCPPNSHRVSETKCLHCLWKCLHFRMGVPGYHHLTPQNKDRFLKVPMPRLYPRLTEIKVLGMGPRTCSFKISTVDYDEQ